MSHDAPQTQSVVIRLERPTGGASTKTGSDAGSEVGADQGHKSDVEPTHLS